MRPRALLHLSVEMGVGRPDPDDLKPVSSLSWLAHIRGFGNRVRSVDPREEFSTSVFTCCCGKGLGPGIAALSPLTICVSLGRPPHVHTSTEPVDEQPRFPFRDILVHRRHACI